MSSAQPIRPRMVGKATFSFALVASQYNQEYVQGLVTHAHQELNELEPGCAATLVWAPGAFEIPAAIALAALRLRLRKVLGDVAILLTVPVAHPSPLHDGAASRIALTSRNSSAHSSSAITNARARRPRGRRSRLFASAAYRRRRIPA